MLLPCPAYVTAPLKMMSDILDARKLMSAFIQCR
jgi:hypothetical protein